VFCWSFLAVWKITRVQCSRKNNHFPWRIKDSSALLFKPKFALEIREIRAPKEPKGQISVQINQKVQREHFSSVFSPLIFAINHTLGNIVIRVSFCHRDFDNYKKLLLFSISLPEKDFSPLWFPGTKENTHPDKYTLTRISPLEFIVCRVPSQFYITITWCRSETFLGRSKRPS